MWVQFYFILGSNLYFWGLIIFRVQTNWGPFFICYGGPKKLGSIFFIFGVQKNRGSIFGERSIFYHFEVKKWGSILF